MLSPGLRQFLENIMITMICAVCGSDDVRRDADASWNPELQQWDLCAVYDNATCEQCRGETRIVERLNKPCSECATHASPTD
jgi:DnaJ-class molecular chaperone